jgi:hypothetical protein
MQLPGRLSSSTLGDLLGALHRERTTGALELLELTSSRRHRVHLVMGLVTGVETPSVVPPIGEILRREGHLDAGGVARMLRKLASGDMRAAGEILIAEGLVSDDALRAGLRAQLRAKLDELYDLGDAAIRFHPARRDRPSRLGPLSPSDFLHGRPRTRDGGTRRAAKTSPRAENVRVSANDAYRDIAPRLPLDRERAEALALLGLTGRETLCDVRRAFRRLAAELHPDRLSTAPADAQRESAATFAKITAAYHLLVA